MSGALLQIAEARRKNAWDRLVFAFASAIALQLIYDDVLGWVWFALQVIVQPIDALYWRKVARRLERSGRVNLWLTYVWVSLTTLSFTSLALILWRHDEQHGDYVAAMMLAAAALNTIVTMRGHPGLTFVGIATSLALFAVGPLIAADHVASALLGLAFLIAFVLVTWRRMGELNQLEVRGRQAAILGRRQAEAAAEAKSRFITALSLELRTPLAALLGSAQMLSRTRLPPESARHVRAALEAGEVLMAVLNDAIEMGRIEGGAVRLAPVAASPAALASAVIESWRARAEQKWLELFLTIETTVPRAVRVDPVRVRQILHNLIGASIAATKQGGVRIRVSAVPGEDERITLLFEVTDSAASRSELENRVLLAGAPVPKPAEEGGGLDLGLATTVTLAELMGGSVEAGPAPSGGNRFVFTITAPLADPNDVGREPSDSPARLHVLVADDHAVSARVLAAQLGELGARVTVVSDGRAAIAALMTQAFDLALVDLNLPAADGFEVAAHVRAEGPNRATPIVGMSASAAESDKARCRAVGMDGHFSKPIEARALAREVDRVLARRAAA